MFLFYLFLVSFVTCLFALVTPVSNLVIGLAMLWPRCTFTGQRVTNVAKTLSAESKGCFGEATIDAIKSRMRVVTVGIVTGRAQQLNFVAITGGGQGGRRG